MVLIRIFAWLVLFNDTYVQVLTRDLHNLSVTETSKTAVTLYI